YESDRPAACAARGRAKLHAVATSSHEGSRLGRASIWQGMSGEGLPFSTRPPQSDAPNGSSVRVGFALLAHRTGTGIGTRIPSARLSHLSAIVPPRAYLPPRMGTLTMRTLRAQPR